jgi:hypothetical protein
LGSVVLVRVNTLIASAPRVRRLLLGAVLRVQIRSEALL